MSGSSKVAKRYAKAIFEGSKPEQLEETLQVLSAFSVAYRGSEDLQSALNNPAISIDTRIEIVGEVIKSIAPNNSVAINGVKLLLENRRFGELPGTVLALTAMIEAWKKMRSVQVISAFALSEDERTKMLAQIKGDLGSSASVEWQVDPELIGGLQVKAGDLLLDGSIRTSLERIRESLMQ